MRKQNQLYEVEVKSMALLREGKKGFITYFRGGNKKTIVSNLMKLYPQYTNPADKPNVEIRPISFREYEMRKNGGQINQKAHFVEAEAHLA